MTKAQLRKLRKLALDQIAWEENALVETRQKWADHPIIIEGNTERAERWLAYYRNQIAIIDFALEHGRNPRRSEVTQEPIP